MPKAAVPKASKNEKKVKTAKDDKPKEKRPPTAWNTFMKTEIASWKAANPDKTFVLKDVMGVVKVKWQDAPENPNRGQLPKPSKRAKSKRAAAELPSSSPGVSSSAPSSEL